MARARSVLFTLVILAIASCAWGQVTGTISGFVRDSSGAAITGATVTALMTEQKTQRTAVTNDEGFYNFIGLLPGHYDLAFEAKGFQKQVRSGLELTISQNLRLDSSLAVGTVQTQVDVTASTPLVDTTNATLSGLIDDRRVQDLPLNGRNIMGLASILPGVSNVSAPQSMGDARGGPDASVRPAGDVRLSDASSQGRRRRHVPAAVLPRGGRCCFTGAQRWTAEDAHVTGIFEPSQNSIVRNIAEEEISPIAKPHRTLRPTRPRVKSFDSGIGDRPCILRSADRSLRLRPDDVRGSPALPRGRRAGRQTRQQGSPLPSAGGPTAIALPG